MYSINTMSNSGYPLPLNIQNDLIYLFNAYGFSADSGYDDAGNGALIFSFSNIDSALVGPDRVFSPSKQGV